jgi:hypothetical protein
VPKFVFVIMGLLALLVVAISFDHLEPSTDRQSPISAATLMPCLCVSFFDDTGLALSAQYAHDQRGIEGLVARGRAVALPDDVRLSVLMQKEDERQSRVKILSGSYIGEECWISTQFITRER